jgi:insertion element IS1 protein InsB
VDRATRCILGWAVTPERNEQLFQAVLDRTPQASHYYSDALPTYEALIYYPARHQAMTDKSQTYSVEGDNADLRHYLARLARRSRCFSRSASALRAAIRLFVFCYNSRQLYKQRFPGYPAHLMSFISLGV